MKHIKKIERNNDLSKVLTKKDLENIFQELVDDGARLFIKEKKVNLVHNLVVIIVFEEGLFANNSAGFINDRYNLQLLEKASQTLINVIHCLKRISNYDIVYGIGDNQITIELDNNFKIPDSFFYV